jgi:hypothetical protein
MLCILLRESDKGLEFCIFPVTFDVETGSFVSIKLAPAFRIGREPTPLS